MVTQEIIDEVRFLTLTDTETYSDSEILSGLNSAQGEFMMSMLSWKGFSHVTENIFKTDMIDSTGLSAGDIGYQGEYPFDSRWIKINRAEFIFETGGTPQRANIIDLYDTFSSDIDPETAPLPVIDDQQMVLTPTIQIQRESYKIRPIPTEDVPFGIYIWAETRQDDIEIADIATAKPIGEPNFHMWYVYKLALRYGRFRPNLTRGDVLAEMVALSQKAALFYKIQNKKNKNLNPRPTSFA